MMPRLLHLLEPTVDPQADRVVAQIRRGLASSFDIEVRYITQQPSSADRHYSSAVAAILDLRRHPPEIDIVHAWGDRSLRAAAFAAGGSVLVYTPSEEFGRSSVRWLRATAQHRELHVMAPSATIQRICIERGLAPERCHLIRPGVDFARIQSKRNAELRGKLGLEPEDVVLLPMGPSTLAADHRLAVWAAGILHVLDQRYKCLLWGEGGRADSMGAFARQLRMPTFFRDAQKKLGRALQFEDLLPAADVLLLTATKPITPCFIPVAMASALPIVGVVSPTASEMLEDRHSALFAARPLPRLLAQRVMELSADPTLQWRIADTARAEAYQLFSQSRFLEQASAFYHGLLLPANRAASA